MRRIALAAVAIAVAALVASPAFAEKPGRGPLPPLEPLVIEDSCPFDVLVEAIREKQVGTFFSSGKLLITGQLMARVTNLGTGASLDVNIPGSAVVTQNPDGTTTAWLRGRNLVFLWPTDAGGPALLLTSGTTTIVNDADFNTLVFETTGHAQDVCALLS